MREGAVIAVAPGSVVPTGIALISVGTAILLAELGLEYVGMIEDLFLGVRLLAARTRRADSINLNLAIWRQADVDAELG